MSTPEFRLCVRMELDKGILRVWTGNGSVDIKETLTDSTETYSDGATLMEGQGDALRFGLRGLGLMGTPVTGRNAVVYTIGSRDEGESWTVLPFIRQGLLSSPQLSEGVYSVEVSPPVYVAPPKLWNHEAHISANPGDSFFSQMRALAKGIDGIHFPDVPPYRRNAQYNILAVSTPPSASISKPGNPDTGLGGASSPKNPGVVVVGPAVNRLAASLRGGAGRA